MVRQLQQTWISRRGEEAGSEILAPYAKRDSGMLMKVVCFALQIKVRFEADKREEIKQVLITVTFACNADGSKSCQFSTLQVQTA